MEPMLALRYGLPAVLILAGFVILFVSPGSIGVEGWAMCVGAGLSVLLLNWALPRGSQGRRGARAGGVSA